MRIFGHWGALLRRLRRNKDGVAAIEFALLLPVLMTMSFGIMEISLCMASLVTLEGGLKQASRYGITGQANATPTVDQQTFMTNYTPSQFSTADNRTKMIMAILNQNTLNLINLNNATITTKIYSSFSAVKNGEPFVDRPDHPHPGDPANGVYDVGEQFSDLNCNGHWDGPGASGTGAGTAGDIVVYTVHYDWPVLTPFAGPLIGKLKSGKYVISMSASVVVKNEPTLSGSTFCS